MSLMVTVSSEKAGVLVNKVIRHNKRTTYSNLGSLAMDMPLTHWRARFNGLIFTRTDSLRHLDALEREVSCHGIEPFTVAFVSTCSLRRLRHRHVQLRPETCQLSIPQLLKEHVVAQSPDIKLGEGYLVSHGK